jgi:pimeloyl-ACP methyl ester carboxylesterase
MHERKTGGIHFTCGCWPLEPQKPTLVFIHGSGESSALWQAQVDALVDVANTLAVDLPGHGQSDPPGMDRIEAYTQAMADFVTTVGAPAPIPCGLSIGGAISQQLLLDHPGMFSAGILVSTGARLRVLPAILEMVNSDFEGFLTALGGYAVSEKTDPGRVRSIMDVTAACPPEVVFGDLSACDRFDVMARLGEIDVPVLVVSAADDRLTPPNYGEFLESRIRGARRVLIPDAGHLVAAEQPEAFNAAVRAFLDRL